MRRLRIESNERLVEHKQTRLMNQRGNNGELLLHTMRIGGNRRAEIAGKLEHCRVLFDSCVARVRGNAEYVSDEIQILDAGHEFIQIGIVGDICGDLLCFHGSSRTEMPSMRISPSVKSRIPHAALSEVVLPAPLWPINP